MIRTEMLSPIMAIAALGLAANGACAQDESEEWRAIPWSQVGRVEQTIAYTDVSVGYARPVARGRDVFGGVVNWGRIWNPGADSATTFGTSEDILVNGQTLAAGYYTLWMIPAESGPWTVIFNRSVNIYHTPYPGKDTDVLRLTVEPEQGAHMETLAFYFPVVEKNESVLRMHWGTTIIALSIEASLDP